MLEGAGGNSSTRPAKKLFSVQQANRALPLVQRIVQDILQTSSEVRDLQEQFESLDKHGEQELAQQTLAKLDSTRQLYQKYLRELGALGCSLADCGAGAVDFPCVRDGREIILSWKLGEPQIGYWHDPAEGPSRRHPLQELIPSPQRPGRLTPHNQA